MANLAMAIDHTFEPRQNIHQWTKMVIICEQNAPIRGALAQVMAMVDIA